MFSWVLGTELTSVTLSGKVVALISFLDKQGNKILQKSNSAWGSADRKAVGTAWLRGG
jgi:hypothetical protein